ncbi:SET domain-containing protein [Metschnikowia bicuspidata var. bicuspidata NRRL YB-4993]|uniref:Histone-lysine N-methyltransferase, H3 lysine-36 specific n=1 Tax=Metschnikowia bicuspidata var. bicuspidata NRRL YB-4993 TaxID=869754 RepID=A0A1A0H9R1_9ASCO|nr:SET domain-containing protein [Metschnikowia bicuspidata var. bicuspidata NRRL YB-4993]OBA20730.1 SET domain-containing protein [Metschnikowia bicuspidata var. bicuspidata NRRL YB-4993]
MSDKENTPELFIDSADKTAEALATFIPIAECVYHGKHLGRSGQKETMTCDCPEHWDEASASNLACGEDSNCINRVTSVECTNKGCLCGKDCQNQRFQKQQYCDVKVIQTEKKGYGLVANERIPEQLFIYEYVGEVIGEDSFRQRMVDYDTRQIRHFYFMMLTKDAFIDATEKGCLARFCNHSCLPNSYVDKWVVGDKLRMGIFSKRAIEKGEEITFDYNVDRYGAQLQPCYCGSASCIGWMGGKTQTDAALLLPDGLSEALGVTKQQERAWLKVNKKVRNAQDPDAGVNEEFVKSVEVASLTDGDVARAMSALMKAEEPSIVEKLVERVYLTEEPRINSLIVKFHGYKTLSRVLKENASKEDMVVRILLTLKRWPSMTRNKIELSQIEDVVKEIVDTLLNAEIHSLAQDLLAEWSQLQMAYRIPKNNENAARADDKTSMSPDYGRNPRSELPGNAAGWDAEKQDAEPLPPGWQKALDTNTNTYYYYHKGMGISKWEHPASAVPKGPKLGAKKESTPQKEKAPVGKEKPPRHAKKFDDSNPHKIHEDYLRKEKEDQFNGVLEKEKLLQELILKSQQEAAEKKRLEEQAKQDRIAKIKERQRRREAAAVASASMKEKNFSVSQSLWTNTLARYVPNLIKKHEGSIGHENIKGCARELVKVLAAKELKKDPKSSPPKELDGAKIKKLREFCDVWMDKFLVKFHTKRARTNGSGKTAP